RVESRRDRLRRLLVERLEDRTLLSISIVGGLGNSVSIQGSVGDDLWLRTSGANFQYSADGTNYSDLGVTTSQDATIFLGSLGTVHLGTSGRDTIVGRGHAITLEAISVAGSVAGQLASPESLLIDNIVATGGGDLSILNIQGIEVSPGVTVS